MFFISFFPKKLRNMKKINCFRFVNYFSSIGFFWKRVGVLEVHDR